MDRSKNRKMERNGLAGPLLIQNIIIINFKFKGIDPETDIRGGGYMAIENILYISNKYPVAYQDLVWKRKGTRSKWEYPFAIAGVNLTFHLKGDKLN